MKNTDRTNGAHDYLLRVAGALSALPSPAMTAAVMRGAGVRWSSPADRLRGPRRLLIDTQRYPEALDATGPTEVQILTRQLQRRSALDERLTQIEREELDAQRADHGVSIDPRKALATDLLEALRTTPVTLEADFHGVFAETAALAGLALNGNIWEVRAITGETSPVIVEQGQSDDSVRGIRDDSIAFAARLRRLFDSLHEKPTDSDDEGGAMSGTLQRAAEPATDVEATAPAPAGRGDLPVDLAARRKRFPELFPLGADGSGERASAATLAVRRRRYPELFGIGVGGSDRQAGDEGFEIG